MEDHKVIETVLFLSWSMGKPIGLCGVNPILRNARISAFFFRYWTQFGLQLITCSFRLASGTQTISNMAFILHKDGPILFLGKTIRSEKPRGFFKSSHYGNYGTCLTLGKQLLFSYNSTQRFSGITNKHGDDSYLIHMNEIGLFNITTVIIWFVVDTSNR